MNARTWLTTLVLSAAAMGLSQAHHPNVPEWPGEQPCEAGQFQLAWDLPSSGPNGVATGVFFLGQSTSAYAFNATLVDTTPPGCLACLNGMFQGVLDDGVGSGPDYIVRGVYGGASLTSSGTLRGGVFDPVTNARVGRFHGDFSDMPTSTPQFGVAAGSWLICD